MAETKPCPGCGSDMLRSEYEDGAEKWECLSTRCDYSEDIGEVQEFDLGNVLTLRDQLAMAAMQAMAGVGFEIPGPTALAQAAYEVADAMLAEKRRAERAAD